jgi:hypothetical protein
MNAFKINVNRPSVRTVTGRVRRKNIGLISALTRLITKTAIRALPKSDR